MKRLLYVCCFTLLLVVMSGCQFENGQQDKQNEVNDHETREAALASEEAIKKAGESEAMQVILLNTEGKRTGIATLEEENTSVNIHLEAWDLSEGPHGFHIHEHGICEEPSFESAGGHFNPTNKEHGFDHPEGPHAGDLPNIEVGEDGTIKESITTELVTLKEGEDNSLLKEGGTSLVIHADADDYISQPAGDSGKRIACGVIAK